MEQGRYDRTPLRKMTAMPVVTLQTMTNRMVSLPAGTVMRVTGKNRGLDLEGEPCACCGVAPRMGGVEPGKVQFLADLVHDEEQARECRLAADRPKTVPSRLSASCPDCRRGGTPGKRHEFPARRDMTQG